MKYSAISLAAFTILSACSLSDFPTMKPIGTKNLTDVSALVALVQCDLKAGADHAAGKDLAWVKNIRYAVGFHLTVVDSQGLGGGATLSTPLAGGLILLSGNLGNSSKATRSTQFDLIVDTTQIKSCPDVKDRPIKGSLGLLEWQHWLINTVADAKNNKNATPFLPHKATFTVSFEIDNAGSLGPRFNSSGAGALDTGSGSLSRGRKTTHKIVIVAEEFIERSERSKPSRNRDVELLKTLQQRELSESLQSIR